MVWGNFATVCIVCQGKLPYREVISMLGMCAYVRQFACSPILSLNYRFTVDPRRRNRGGCGGGALELRVAPQLNVVAYRSFVRSTAIHCLQMIISNVTSCTTTNFLSPRPEEDKQRL